MTTLDPDAAREHVEGEHAAIVDAVESCADEVAAAWDGDSTADGSAVSVTLEAALADAGVLDALPGVLQDTVDAAGGEMQAEPVAAPPYVVVTSRGPVLRATLPVGRLVVRFAVFRVTEDGRYECTSEATSTVQVRVR